MERAVEIKRRAQRFILNGDLDGAMREYEKLVSSGDADPYHSVLLGDLLFKKGEQGEAVKRYMDAVDGYEKSGLYKNAIAVCKKMTRLSFAPAQVLQRLARLHAQDGLAAEAGLYYLQHAELMMQQNNLEIASDSLRLAFDLAPDNVKPLERLAELKIMIAEPGEAAAILTEAATHHDRLGQLADARRCRARAEQIQPGGVPAAVAAPTRGAGSDEDSADGEPSAGVGVEEMPAADAAPAPPRPQVYEVAEPNVLGDSMGTMARPKPPDAAPAPRARQGLAGKGITPPGRAPGGLKSAPAPSQPPAPPARPPQPAPAEAGATMDMAALTGSFEVERFTSMIGALKKQDGIDEGQAPQAQAPAAGASASEPLVVEHDEGAMGETPESPGLAPGSAEEEAGLADVHHNLNEAQQLFREGRREAAGASLAAAAQAYDSLGRLDSAAAIYRSLSQAMDPPLQVMLLWLKNCQRRGDRREAAQVACVLGDRSLNDGDAAGAREWFERARALDERNEVVARRLMHLSANAADNPGGAVAEWIRVDPAIPPGGGAAIEGSSTTHEEEESPAPPPAPKKPAAAPARPAPVAERRDTRAPEPAPAEPAAPVAEEPPAPSDPHSSGKVAVSVDGENNHWGADLAELVSEFQRGVEAHIADDPQVLYDFGLSYREMGLADEALEAFRNAAKNPSFTAQATEMIVRCLLDAGRADEAVDELRDVLGRPGVDPKSTSRLRYELGVALEAAGRADEALSEYQALQRAHAGLWDVARRIDTLRGSRGQG